MKNLIYILTFVITTTAIAQNTTSMAFEKQKLSLAKSFNDDAVLTSTIYNIIALEGPTSTYKDSLAYIYFNKRNYVSSYLVLNNILKYKPDNVEFLEMKAISLEFMGALDKSKKAYEDLLAKSGNNYHAYKLASIQYRLKQNAAALVSIKKADQLPDSGSLEVNFKVNENYNQNVPLKAAISYLEGLISQALTKSVEAKVSFERAIELFPKFVLAKSKLELINVKKAAGKEN